MAKATTTTRQRAGTWHMARRLAPRLSKLPNGAQRAQTLRMPASVQIAYVNEWERLVREMHKEASATILREFAKPVATGMDAKESVWERMLRRFNEKFATVAPGLANGMMKRLERDAEQGLQRSLREVAEGFTLTPTNPKNVQKAIDDKVKENVYYIKRIPEQYLESVKKSVDASIAAGGNGLEDLTKVMNERYGEAKRHAKNVALDQTRKAYTAITTARMKDAGIKKFEWVHTGGSQEPRPYHLNELNGRVFSIDEPPIIDKKTGERGLPGDAINCRCTMRPIVTFDFEDDE
jgi:SPP1 gp7 family putative phage head morphogenesis protein